MMHNGFPRGAVEMKRDRIESNLEIALLRSIGDFFVCVARARGPELRNVEDRCAYACDVNRRHLTGETRGDVRVRR